MLSRLGLRRLPLLASRPGPSTVLRRSLSASPLRSVYPEEGVFQKNSPRYVPGFGPAPPVPTQTHPSELASVYEPPPRRTWRSYLPRWYKILGGLILMLAGVYGSATRLFLALPYEEVREEDEQGNETEVPLEAFFEELDALPLVQQLRASHVQVEGGGMKPEWQEWTAYEGFEAGQGQTTDRFTTGPLGGPAGVAAQKVFWNEQDQQICVFIRFGENTQGWPHVVHGGVVSTICDEALGRLAIFMFDNEPPVTATLEVTFLDLVRPGQWHALIAQADEEKKYLNTDRKKFITGTLICCSEDSPTKEGQEILDAHAHAQARALYVLPKQTKLAKISDKF